MRRISPQCGCATLNPAQEAEALPSGYGQTPPPTVDADALEQLCDRSATRVPLPAPGSLGNNTKSVSLKADQGQKKSPVKRDNRYNALAEARRLVYLRGTMWRMPYPANLHRVAKCHVQKINKAGYVGVHYSPSYEAAHFSGLIQCGSPWACPVCSAKLAERRRPEIAQGFEHAYASGGKMMMVTLTFPHTQWDRVGDLLPQQARALKKMRGGKAWQKLKQKIGFRYLIRSLEITHGASGWHPHTHEAWFVDKDTDPDELRAQVTKYWAAACRNAGLLKPDREDDFHAHAVHILDNASASSYLQKQDQEHVWGCDRELASGSSKISKGRHPFALLEASAAGDAESGELFLEYALATKGKAQIYWSRGFKAEAGVNDLSDEELVEEQEEDAIRVVSLSPIQWQKVIDESAHTEILKLAETEGFVGIARWFADRDLRPPDRPRSPPPESPP